jgi:hypothetical protein
VLRHPEQVDCDARLAGVHGAIAARPSGTLATPRQGREIVLRCSGVVLTCWTAAASCWEILRAIAGG